MRSIFRYMTLVPLLLAAGSAVHAQNVTDLRVTELVVNAGENGLMDDYGQKNGWVEIFNNSNGTVNVGGCFITDNPDFAGLTESEKAPFMVPKGVLDTKLGPRQAFVFFGAAADSLGNAVASAGTFHLDFALTEGRTVYIYGTDGRTVIDSLKAMPVAPGKAWGKFCADDDVKQTGFAEQREADPSPRLMNGSKTKSNAQVMKEKDPHGFTLSLTSVSVVFGALLVLFLVYSLSGAIFKRAGQPKQPKVRKVKAGEMNPEIAAAIAMALEQERGGSEVEAAIALALHRYFSESAHDNESFVLTIKREPTAWTDKSLTFRKNPNKK